MRVRCVRACATANATISTTTARPTVAAAGHRGIEALGAARVCIGESARAPVLSRITVCTVFAGNYNLITVRVRFFCRRYNRQPGDS
jgi:hypothetical protein